MRKKIEKVVTVVAIVCCVFWLTSEHSSYIHLVFVSVRTVKLLQLATGVLLGVAALMSKPRGILDWFCAGVGGIVAVSALTFLL